MGKSTKRIAPKRSKVSVKVANPHDGEKPKWSFAKIDRGGPYAFSLWEDGFDCKDFLDKLVSYSSMTWGEIKTQTHDSGKSKHHYLNYDGLSDEARDRVDRFYPDDDRDAIFSFAFDNLWRIVGFRYDEAFYIIWSDPLHEVFPSKKKHT